jgi:hypothetical protein
MSIAALYLDIACWNVFCEHESLVLLDQVMKIRHEAALGSVTLFAQFVLGKHSSHQVVECVAHTAV